MSPPTKPNGRNDPTPALTLREFFAAVFDTIVEEAERNPAFAAKLAERLGQPLTVTSTAAAAAGKRGAVAPPELLALDLKALRANEGELALRERLEGYKNAELAALVRAKRLASGALSKMPKNSLINAIVRAAR